MPTNSMPADWEPPAPAWQSSWKDKGDPLVTGYFGVQADEPASLDQWAAQSFSSEHAPASVERGMYVDQGGISNYLYIAYWRRSEYQQWWRLESSHAWWADSQRLKEGAGYWREIVVMPFDRFETLHSTETPHGVGVSADRMDGPIMEHGYPGGARDRIPVSESDPLTNVDSVATELQAKVIDDGRRILITPPENMCVIRSGQNWSQCGAEEKAYYRDNVHPVLLEGMRFLRDNPAESNCYSLRFVDVKNENWNLEEQSSGLGYSTDIYAFEDWAKSHPTHLAIFDSFMKMVERFGENMKLQLWHEVTVLPRDGCEFEYVGCHPKTGLLNYI